tara:strand:+ start:871 stop:1569 length:699 start_codon:yes stop_codon:yes gene_type:complete
MPETPPLQPGTLYLVATPIGNLEDITLRALRVLRECDIVAAEDTRRARQLLKLFEISKPTLSCHQFNEVRRSAGILRRLENGEIIALISDAGTPGISDPGERLVRAVLAAGHRVEPVPGPCAAVAALAAAGLPTDQFFFAGFPPHKSGQRRNRLVALAAVPGTLVFYESPHRILKFLSELNEIWPACPVVVGREITKKFEEFLRGTAGEILAQMEKTKTRGEFVVLAGEPRA